MEKVQGPLGSRLNMIVKDMTGA